VHALIFSHQQLQRAIFAFVLVELEQVPLVPRRLGHGLIGVIESGFGECVAVPLQARYLTRFAADASRGVNQFADLLCAFYAGAGDGPRMA